MPSSSAKLGTPIRSNARASTSSVAYAGPVSRTTASPDTAASEALRTGTGAGAGAMRRKLTPQQQQQQDAFQSSTPAAENERGSAVADMAAGRTSRGAAAGGRGGGIVITSDPSVVSAFSQSKDGELWDLFMK